MEKIGDVVHSKEMIEIMGRTPFRIYVLASTAITSALLILILIVFFIKIDQRENLPCTITESAVNTIFTAQLNSKYNQSSLLMPKKIMVTGFNVDGDPVTFNLPVQSVRYQFSTLKGIPIVQVITNNNFQKQLVRKSELQITTEKSLVNRLFTF